jgi:hypothetical protein
MQQTQNISTHARKRMQQRAISDKLLPFLFEYGAHQSAGNGCRKWVLTRKAVEQLRRDIKDVLARLDSAQDAYLVEGEGGCIVTVGHSYRSGKRRGGR